MPKQYSRFELVSKYTNESLLPNRATQGSAGYDFYVARDIVVPSYNKHIDTLNMFANLPEEAMSLEEVAKNTNALNVKPTLVPTGVKAYMPENFYLQLSLRSSCPLKYWLVLANGVGIIDSDYVDNDDNEGEIFFQVINLFPQDIILREGDRIGQGVFLRYYTTAYDEGVGGLRIGGLGSTTTE